MAGVGQTGVWRTGVWVEPLDAEGSFETFGSALVSFDGRFSFAGQFVLSGTAVLSFLGHPYALGEFTTDASGLLSFDGNFVPNPGSGIFITRATATLSFAWVPDLGPPTGGEVIPEEGPGSVEIPFRPGQVLVIDGVSGVVVKDSYGRLCVMDDSGQVMCILGPGGVEFP